MDSKVLKEKAKKVIAKNHWLSVAVALFMTLGGATAGGFSFNFDFSINSDELNTPYWSEPAVQNLDEFFIGFFIAIWLVILVTFVLTVLVFSTFRCGGIRYFLKLRKDQPVQFTEILANFKDKTFLQIAKHTFFKELFIIFWTLLFIIPGIIKGYEYWAIDYILAVRPNIDRKELFRLSKEIMSGHKAECFVLTLTFFGWIILNGFTFGLLGIFWLNPYMEATFVEFFAEIRREAIEKGKITPDDIPDYNFPTPPQQFGSPFLNNAPEGFYGAPENAQYGAPQATVNTQPSQYTPYIPPMNAPSFEQNNSEDIPQQGNNNQESSPFNNDSAE